MTIRNFALIAGIAYLVVGVAGFVPTLLSPPPPGARPVRLDRMYGYLFGLFPVNVAHSLVHVLLGGWGVVAARRFDAARAYAQSLAVIYGVLTIMGLVPGLNTVFGLIPIHGHDVWLHASPRRWPRTSGSDARERSTSPRTDRGAPRSPR